MPPPPPPLVTVNDLSVAPSSACAPPLSSPRSDFQQTSLLCSHIQLVPLPCYSSNMRNSWAFFPHLKKLTSRHTAQKVPLGSTRSSVPLHRGAPHKSPVRSASTSPAFLSGAHGLQPRPPHLHHSRFGPGDRLPVPCQTLRSVPGSDAL